MRPAPPAMVSAGSNVALFISAILICAGGQAWCSAFSSAAAPATCGVAIEVPLSVAYALPRYDDRIDCPGAITSGFTARFFMFGPRDEKLEIVSVTSVEPTVIALRAVPGLEIV